MAFDASLWGRQVLITGLSPTATISGYIARITEDNLPDEMHDAGSNSMLNGGGDVRASTDAAGTNQLPFYPSIAVTSATPANRSSEMWVRFDSYESAARGVYLTYNRAGQSQPAVDAAFGRDEVFQDLRYSPLLDGDTVDASGNEADGTLTGTPTVTADNKGYAFDGNNESIDSSYTASSWGSGEGTLTALFEVTTKAHFHALTSKGGTGSNEYDIWLGIATTGFGGGVWMSRNDSTFLEGGTVNVDTIYCAHGRVDSSGDGEVFVDGVSVNSDTDGTSLSDNYSTIFTGRSGASTNHDTEGNIYLAFHRDVGISDAHIDMEGQNFSDPSTFWTTGTPQDTPSGSSTVNTDIRLSWNILNSVESDVSLTWNILNSGDTDLIVEWNILNGVQTDLSILWNILNSENTDLSVLWEILSSLTNAQTDLSLAWDILSRVDSDVSFTWNILNSVNSDLNILWNILNSVDSDTSLLWKILQGESTDLTLDWSIIGTINTDLELQWRIDSDSTFNQITGRVTLNTATGKVTMVSNTGRITYS